MSDGAIWMVGCGTMGGAMLGRWLASGVDPRRFTVIDPAGPNVGAGVRMLSAAPPEQPPEILLLAIKPQSFVATAAALEPATRGAITVSIMAGIRTAALQQRFPAARIVRAMPNLPVAIGKGVVGLFGEVSSAVAELMAPLGHVEWLSDEDMLDAVTALGGSGPAFVYRFIAALARAGSDLGLPQGQALRLSLATVDGAATFAASSAATPAELAERVASKGGSTREGLNVLDADDALGRLMFATLEAAVAKNRELAGLSAPG